MLFAAGFTVLAAGYYAYNDLRQQLDALKSQNDSLRKELETRIASPSSVPPTIDSRLKTITDQVDQLQVVVIKGNGKGTQPLLNRVEQVERAVQSLDSRVKKLE